MSAQWKLVFQLTSYDIAYFFLAGLGQSSAQAQTASDAPNFRSIPLQLGDALAACALSNRIAPQLRQWASKHLLDTLSSLRCHADALPDNMTDLTSDLPACASSKLEAHQNRVTGCAFSDKKGLLASCAQDGTVRVWSVPNSSQAYLQQTCVFARSSNDELAVPDDFDTHLLSHLSWSPSAKFIAAAMDGMINIWSLAGGRGHLDVQSHWVTALTFPRYKGLFEGSMGLATDCLVVGRLNGSVALIDIVGQSFRRSELQHCSRQDGESIF